MNTMGIGRGESPEAMFRLLPAATSCLLPQKTERASETLVVAQQNPKIVISSLQFAQFTYSFVNLPSSYFCVIPLFLLLHISL
jgi:hypothetical protein